jgi:hypothetical protein
MAFHALEISFPLDFQPPHYRSKPGNFVAHFVGHEGPGSLHSYLKTKGWVTSLTAGPQSLARGFANFKVTMQLTQEGFSEYICPKGTPKTYVYPVTARKSSLGHTGRLQILLSSSFLGVATLVSTRAKFDVPDSFPF